jgi:hypothetical protein
MLELNCSYEESKRILELGYDFSKVCWKSLYKYRDQYNLNRTFIKIHIHGTHLSLASIEDEIKHRMSKYGIVDLVTPIIPKAALEACLPDYDGYDNDSVITYTWAGHTSMRSVCFIPEWNRFTSAISIDEYLTKHHSAFEAFLWCHENYPDELKKKFDEVMA